MPPRYVYWTILAGGLPTAFRAAKREELLPTFKRLKEKHPDAEMKYFARGRLWASSEDAERDAVARRAAGGRSADRRGRNWRPGGDHKDPRQKYKNTKKKRNLDWRRRRFEQRQRPGKSDRAADRPVVPPDRVGPKRPSRDARPSGSQFRNGPPRDGKRFGKPLRHRSPRDGKPFEGPPRGSPPRGGKPFQAPPRDRKSLGGPPSHPHDRRPFGGTPRDRAPRPYRPAGGPPRDKRRRS